MNQLCGLALIVFLGVAPALAQDVRVPTPSTWELDVNQSDFGGLPAPRSRMMTITSDTPQKLTFRGSGKTNQGKKEIFYWNGPKDGALRRLRGTKDKASFTSDGKSHWVLQGGSTEDDQTSLSADGKTMTVSGKLKERNGAEHDRKLVYVRVK